MSQTSYLYKKPYKGTKEEKEKFKEIYDNADFSFSHDIVAFCNFDNFQMDKEIADTWLELIDNIQSTTGQKPGEVVYMSNPFANLAEDEMHILPIYDVEYKLSSEDKVDVISMESHVIYCPGDFGEYSNNFIVDYL